MAVTRTKFSERMQGPNVAVDVLALSPQARTQAKTVLTTATIPVTQNTTKKIAVPVTAALKVTAASATFVTAPAVAGGTSTYQIDYVASDGTTTTNIVAAATVLGKSNLVPFSFTVVTGVTCAAGGQIVVTGATSNNAVGTADVGGCLTLAYERIEDTTISDSDNSTAVA